MSLPDPKPASPPLPPPTPPPPVLPYASPVPGASPMLSAEHLAQLAAARKLASGLRRAAAVAKADGWTTGIFGALTLALSIGSIPGMVLGAGMATLGVMQLKSADRLRQLDEKAPAALARNQVFLGLLLFLYGAFSLMTVIRNPVSLSAEISGMDPEMAQMLAPYNDLAQSLYAAVYVGVMGLAIIAPGLTALYYRSQRKRIATYRSSTPQWILSLQSAGVTI